MSKKQTIVLAHPLTGFWDSFRSAPALPLNLLHASSAAAQEFDIELIDLRIDRRWKSALLSSLAKKPVLIGLTSMIGPATSSSIEIADFVKKVSSVPVALGGVHASLNHLTALNHPSIDFVILGEGELPTLNLARALSTDSDTNAIMGVRSKSNSFEPFVDSEFLTRINLDDCPEIPYHVARIDSYLQYFDGVCRYISMETSRGCPYKCGYCYHSMPQYSGWRSQNPDRVAERLVFLKNNFNVNGIYFVDDNFFIDIGRAARIAGKMAETNMNWQVQGVDIAALNKMDDEFFYFLSRCGLRRITVGVDSGSDVIRNKIGKQLSSQAVIETVRRMSKFPIIVYCSFIANFPGETAEDIKKTTQLISSLYDANLNFRNSPIYQFVPFPGTRLAKEMVSTGFNWPSDFADWSKYSFETGYGADNAMLGRDFYASLYYITMFSDRKTEEYLNSNALKTLSKLYRPIALFRLKRFFIKHFPDLYIILATRKLFFLLYAIVLKMRR